MRWLLGLVVLPIALVLGVFFAVSDAKPKLDRSVQLSMADLDRGKAIVDSLGLRKMKEGEIRQLVLSVSDIDLGVNYLAHHVAHGSTHGSAHGSASAQIVLSQLIVRASFPLPLPDALPVPRRFVNVELVLGPADALLRPEQLRVGKLDLPAALVNKLLFWGLAQSPYAAQLAAVGTMLNSAQISGQKLAMRFTWHGAALEEAIGGAMVPGVDEAALSVYRARLDQSNSRDFAVLLGEVFALAKTRSAQSDPILENRAALISLAERALGSRLLSKRAAGDPAVKPTDKSTDKSTAKPVKNRSLQLAGRQDYSQHFALSAFLSATGGAGLSDMAGLYKELKDAQGGSGFSFNDLAADRAGSRLGEACTRSRASALKMQKRLAGVRDAEMFFPAINDLPEFMPQAEFARRFGGVGQPAYRKMVDQIEARIAALPLFK
jgi:uncharacterized protein YfiM (DUF2279 family)